MESQEIIAHRFSKSPRNTKISYYYFYKRCMDMVLSIVLLIILLPLFLVVAILIKLDSPGPVIFTQERVGSRKRHGGWEIQNFKFYKFRSMTHNADQSVHQAFITAFVSGNRQVSKQIDTEELIATNTQQKVKSPSEAFIEAFPSKGKGLSKRAEFKLVNDSRVTRVGKFIRRTSLDELPQLVNVLKGEMSLVGPRPVPVYEFAQYQTWQCERMKTLPGMTGLWQVKGRGRTTCNEQICLDLEYIQRQSLWLDIKILFFTIPAVLSGQGAR